MINLADDRQKRSLIFLTGFMASGKSTVGCALAEALHKGFYDLDVEIEARMGKSIAAIFQDEGAAFFREIEQEILIELCEKENAVIALGGGTLLDYENLQIVGEKGMSICLYTTPEETWKRIEDSGKRRLIAGPDFQGRILRSDTQIYKRIETLMSVRKPGYDRSDIMIDSTNKTIPQIVQEILIILEPFLFMNYNFVSKNQSIAEK